MGVRQAQKRNRQIVTQLGTLFGSKRASDTLGLPLGLSENFEDARSEIPSAQENNAK